MIFNWIKDGVYFIEKGTNFFHSGMEIYFDFNEENPYFLDLGKKNGQWEEIEIPLEDYLKEKDLFTNEKELWLAKAYEVSGFFLFDKEPIKIVDVIGSGFNYGSLNIVSVDKPGKILILAQND